jgi:DNA repair protein RadC
MRVCFGILCLALSRFLWDHGYMRIKDIPKIDRPRERFLERGPDALSKSELLAILLGSGIKGKNVKQLSEQIIRKFGSNFLDITTGNLLEIPGIGEAKALQIVSALALVKRFFEELGSKNNIVLSAQDAVSLTSEIRDKKKEHLVCLYLNARNALLKKETISIGILDKSIIHPREIFGPAVELRAAGIVLLHNHP